MKFRTRFSPAIDKGEVNEEESKTFPDLHQDPRTVLENHVRGINPITGAILDNQRYYGDAIKPYANDLTFEELRIKREGLEQQLLDLNEKLTKSTGQEPDSEPTTDSESGSTQNE